MKKFLFVLFMMSAMASCDKARTETDPFVICIETHSWLNDLVKEYQQCVCLTKIMQGMYKGEMVFEVRGIDPLCDGINIVYKADGTGWFTSADKLKYDDYLSSAEVKEVWRCSKELK